MYMLEYAVSTLYMRYIYVWNVFHQSGKSLFEAKYLMVMYLFIRQIKVSF